MLVVLYVLCMLIWPWPDPRLRSRSLSFWSSQNCTFLGLSPPPFWHGAQNWSYDNMEPSLQPNLWISFSLSYHVTSNFMECGITGLSKGYISLLLKARVKWLDELVVLYVLCMLISLTRYKVKLKVTWRWPSAPFWGLYSSTSFIIQSYSWLGQLSLKWILCICGSDFSLLYYLSSTILMFTCSQVQNNQHFQ